tara:strand:+ start:496 stop:600 length:105 start_codon:yes stop_codon:yes gene_type:complete
MFWVILYEKMIFETLLKLSYFIPPFIAIEERKYL